MVAADNEVPDVTETVKSLKSPTYHALLVDVEPEPIATCLPEYGTLTFHLLKTK